MQKNVCSKESCASITLYLCPVCSTFSWLKLHLKTWIWSFLPEPGDNHSIYNLNVICVVTWSCPGNRCEVGKFLWSTQVTSDELFSGWECSLIRSPDKVLGMSVVEWMGLLESVVGCVIWMTVVTWAVRCLRPCVVGSMSECVVMCVVGWVGAGWLWFWLTDGMTVCWLCSEVSEGCLRPCVVGSMSECVVMCVVGWVGAGWLWSWLTDGMTVCWLCSEVSEGCLRPCVVGSMSECVVMCVVGWVGAGWLIGWLCVDCAVKCPRGVWGRVWLGPWVNVWLDVVGWVGAVCLGQWVGVWLSVGGEWGV